jgi:hypothetical protein
MYVLVLLLNELPLLVVTSRPVVLACVNAFSITWEVAGLGVCDGWCCFLMSITGTGISLGLGGVYVTLGGGGVDLTNVSTLGGAGLGVGVGAWLTGALLTVELVVVGLLEEELVVLRVLDEVVVFFAVDGLLAMTFGIIASLPYCFLQERSTVKIES